MGVKFPQFLNIKKGLIMKDTIIAILFGIVGALLLVEWAVGCGEAYIDSKGITHTSQCVFINR